MKVNWKKEFEGVKLYSPEQQYRDKVRQNMLDWVRDDILPLLTVNVEAIILWQLHERYGFGKKRLLQFLDETTPLINGILDKYEYDKDDDAIWICKYKLKTELGIDLEDRVSSFNATLKLV